VKIFDWRFYSGQKRLQSAAQQIGKTQATGITKSIGIQHTDHSIWAETE
jgi:hypothetical protein